MSEVPVDIADAVGETAAGNGKSPTGRGSISALLDAVLVETSETATAAPPSGGMAAASSDAAAQSAPESVAADWLDDFLSAKSPLEAISLWLAQRPSRKPPRSRRELAMALNRDRAYIDEVLSRQINAILHHPRFQKFEATWRGLRYLVDQADGVENMQIRVLHVTWREIARDADLAIEFDQSALFRKVYEAEFGTAGGTPYTVLIGDYEIRHRLAKDHPVDDIATLRAVAQVAASAFAPFIAGVHPTIFGMESFEPFERAPNLTRIFDSQNLEYLPWRTLRHDDDARFVGLAMPRVLMRLPYEDQPRRDGFIFREDVSKRSNYLWGNAAFAFGGVLIRAFANCKWFADIRGVQRGMDEGGIVAGLPVHYFRTDRPGVAPKCSVEVMLTDDQEKELSELGFIPLCHCQDTEYEVFYANQSIQKPEKYDTVLATVNARMSAMLQYMLCSSRFAHYIKVIARDKIGLFSDSKSLQTFLHNWLQQYVAGGTGISAEVKAKFPLRSAKVTVRDHPGKPGHFLTDVHLWPHFQLDELTASVKLVTEFPAAAVT
ncbi:MAG: type VI secretion system contractile sheath large subunit [Planctomycetota bacterium]|nr:MAG: type VI secretion system contractile sheath large subunit [Planctomycetota bacterium]